MNLNLIDNIIFDDKVESYNLYDAIKAESLPLIMWGAGNLADQVYHRLLEHDININAVFVDTVNNIKFHNLSVMTLNQITEKYSEFNVIMGHSAYHLGRNLNKNNPKIKNIYYINNPFSNHNNIDYKYFLDNINRYNKTFNLLSDSESKYCMIDYLNARINDNSKYIYENHNNDITYFKNDILSVSDNEVFVDVGAYDGDSIRQLLSVTDDKYKKIIAIEPEKLSFKRLNNYMSNKSLKNIDVYNVGVWKEKTKLKFTIGNDQSSGISTNYSGIDIDVDTIDSISENENVTFIKMYIPIGSLEMLMGAKETIVQNCPKLAIGVGFNSDAIIDIPQYIKKLNPDYKLYLRFNSSMASRLVLYAHV